MLWFEFEMQFADYVQIILASDAANKNSKLYMCHVFLCQFINYAENVCNVKRWRITLNMFRVSIEALKPT